MKGARVVDLGLAPYGEVEALQLRTVDEVLAGGRETLFLVEHPPVITLGRGGGAEHLHVDPAWLAERGVEVVPIARGGNVTCHFPGQLVAYPVFRVSRGRGGVRGFFHNMERAVLETLAHFGLRARREEGRPGVWMDGTRKICSMGIGVRRWVAFHGLALNVLPDVSLFDLVTPCGLPDVRVTSVHAELDRLGATVKPTIQEVKNVLAERIRDVFAHSQVVAPSPAARS